MFICIYTHKYGVDTFLARNEREVESIRYDIARRYFDQISSEEWTGLLEQVDFYWQHMEECSREWFESNAAEFYFTTPVV